MKNHTPMQTIARANRVFRDKRNGLIVDYVGVFRNLQKALAIYAAQGSGIDDPQIDSPIKAKSELVLQLRGAISTAIAFCKERQIDPAKIRDARGFERERLKEDAVAALVVNDETRAQYLNLASAVESLLKSLRPDARAEEFGPVCNVFKVVAEKIRSELPVVDILAVMADVTSPSQQIHSGGWLRYAGGLERPEPVH
jgi:type I restriction enzyme, R subunit